jgi:beta-lactamase class D
MGALGVADLQAQVAETRALMREVEAAISEGSSLETLLNLVTHAFPGNRDEAAVTPNKQGDTVLASEVEEAQKWIAAWRGTEEAAVPANTREAKAWIGAWRGKQGTSETTVDQVDEAQRWIKAWRSRQDVKDAIPASVLEARQWIAAWRGRMQGEQVDVLPANVSEAQQWVAAWRGKQQQQADVPVNVKEAQQWIAAWRVMQQRADVPANAREAQGWIAAWRGKQQQQQQQQGDATTVDAIRGVQGWVASWRGRHTSNAATPNSVREAQQWIAAWRGRQGQEAATAEEVKEVQQWVASWRDRHAQQTAVVPSNGTEAREWIEAWRRGRRGNGAAGRITLPSATDPETVLALVKVISAAAESAVAQRGAFCVALSGCHLQNAAFLLASVSHRDDLPNWHIFWAKEANVAHSDADSRYGAATAAFLGSRTFERRAVHAAPISPTVEVCAQGYSAQLQALPPSLLPRQPSGAGLPIFDLILCNDRAGLGTGGFPDGDGESWVVPDPKEPGTVAFSRPVLEAAKSVCIHSSRS